MKAVDARRGLFAAVGAFLFLSSPSSFAGDAAIEARQQAQIQQAFLTDAPAPLVRGERLKTFAQRLASIRGGTDGSDAARQRLREDIGRFAADVAGPGAPPRLPQPSVLRAYLSRVARLQRDRVKRARSEFNSSAARVRARLGDAQQLLSNNPASGEAPSDFLLRSVPPSWRTAEIRAVADDILANSKGQNIGMARGYELRKKIFTAISIDVPYTRQLPDKPGPIQAHVLSYVDALGQAFFDSRLVKIVASLTLPGLVAVTTIEIGGCDHFGGGVTWIQTAKIMASNSLTCSVPGIKKVCDEPLQFAERTWSEAPKTPPLNSAAHRQAEARIAANGAEPKTR